MDQQIIYKYSKLGQEVLKCKYSTFSVDNLNAQVKTTQTSFVSQFLAVTVC